MTRTEAHAILDRVAAHYGMTRGELTICRFRDPRAHAARDLIAAGALQVEVADLFSVTSAAVRYWLACREPSSRAYTPRPPTRDESQRVARGLAETRATVTRMREAAATRSGSPASPVADRPR